jgi:hypothetical protein
MLTYTFIKNEPKRLKLEEIEPMINVMDFSIKTLGITHKQYSFIQDGGMEYAMSTLMLGNGTLKGFMEQLHMSWDILVPTRFGFQ